MQNAEVYPSDGTRYDTPITSEQAIYIDAIYKQIESMCRFARENKLDVLFAIGSTRGYCCTFEYEICLLMQILYSLYQTIEPNITEQQRNDFHAVVVAMNRLSRSLDLEPPDQITERIARHYQTD